MGNGKKKIPDRWEKYSNIGTVVEGTQFIAFKVPLWFEESWNLAVLAQSVPSLKHVVDLTNTDRYYRATDCEKHGWRHVKIKMAGHGEVPSQVNVEKFYSAVRAAEDSGGLIGVHCTHGLNRTGYLISRFLIEKKGWEPQRAIDAFDLARGEKQERENYLEHLRLRGWERLEVNEVSGGGEKSGSEKSNWREFSPSTRQDRKSPYHPRGRQTRGRGREKGRRGSYQNYSDNWRQQPDVFYGFPNSPPPSTHHPPLHHPYQHVSRYGGDTWRGAGSRHSGYNWRGDSDRYGEDTWRNDGGRYGEDTWRNDGGRYGGDTWRNDGGRYGGDTWRNDGGRYGGDTWRNDGTRYDRDTWREQRQYDGCNPDRRKQSRGRSSYVSDRDRGPESTRGGEGRGSR